MDLLTYRLRRRLSQKQMAALLGTTQGTVSRWENGERIPDLRQISKIADITKGQVKAEDFMASLNKRL